MEQLKWKEEAGAGWCKRSEAKQDKTVVMDGGRLEKIV